MPKRTKICTHFLVDNFQLSVFGRFESDFSPFSCAVDDDDDDCYYYFIYACVQCTVQSPPLPPILNIDNGASNEDIANDDECNCRFY